MSLSKNKINSLVSGEILPEDLDIDELVEFCEIANLEYRKGNPIISDSDYDFIYLKDLKKRNPNHPILKKVEPEDNAFSEEKVLLPRAMLSIDKAYSFKEIIKWTEKIQKSAKDLNLKPESLVFLATPKLDGFAGFDDGKKLYTRGDGKKGSDISRVFNRGLKIFNNSERGQGPGEIVVSKSYFKKNLSKYFEFPRNFQASLIKEKELDEYAKSAIKNNGAFFVPFKQLPSWKGCLKDLKNKFEVIVQESLASVDFDVDGVVFEV